MNIFRRSGIRAEQTVGVVGSGFLGSLLIQLATAAGARVLTVSRRPTSRETALLAGADLTLEFGEDGSQVLDRVRTLTNGRGCDVVIEATGKQAPLDLAGELAAERGRLVVAGFHQDGPRTVNMQGWNWKGLDVINAHERDPQVFVEGMRLAVDAVLEGRMDPSPLLTHAFPLERAAEALDLLRTRPEGFIKAYLHTA